MVYTKQIRIPWKRKIGEVKGGVGKSVMFTGDVPGRLTLDGDAGFYLGGVSNCVEILVTGSGKTLDAVRLGADLAALAFETEDGTNTLRCTRPGALSGVESLTSRGGVLVLETAEAFGAGDTPFARVEEGELVFAPSPRAGRPGGGERLARPLALAEASMVVREGARLSFGRRDGGTLRPFSLQVEGESCMRYNVQVLPEFFLIDRGNNLVGRSQTIKDIEQAIKNLL